MATVEQMRFIVMLMDGVHKQHDGQWFCSLREAQEYAHSNLVDKRYFQKAVIGMMVFDPHCKSDTINFVETFGFPKDKKAVEQLELFKPYGKR